MLNPQAGASGSMNIDQLQNTALNVVENVCGIVVRPIEMILRPWHGTRYFPIPVIFLSTMVMIFLPLLSEAATAITNMLPGAGFHLPQGFFGLGSLSKLYFVLSFVHGIRIWRLMISLDEIHSQYEGEQLPFFQVLPKSESFFFTRIVLEPAFVLIVATILRRVFIFDTGLALYLQVGAFMLTMKEFIVWFRSWEYFRDILDGKSLGAIITRMLENRATESEIRTVHMAGFPKNVGPDLRRTVLMKILQIFSPQSSDKKPGEPHDHN
jgi:hypothetical protein